MTTQTEALKLALELLAVGTFHSPELQAKRTDVIKQGLEALEQEPCPDKERDEYTCKNRHQCWEPCGELGKSEQHSVVAQPEQESSLNCERPEYIRNGCIGHCWKKRKQQPKKIKNKESHLFEFWWSTHMPSATQKQAWDAWVSAPRYDGAISLPEPDLISEKTDEPCGYSVEAVRKILSSAPQTQPKEPEQEPDYWLGYGLQAYTDKPFEGATPLYTTPPQRKPLTEDEAVFAVSFVLPVTSTGGQTQYLQIQHKYALEITRAIEAAHGIKE